MAVLPLDPERLLQDPDRIQAARDKTAKEEARDTRQVERGERLYAFVQGRPVAKVWESDLLPLIDELYYRGQTEMVNAPEKAASWAYYCQALRDLTTQLAGSIELGRGAMQRIAERRFGKAGVLPLRRR